jgi:hypothetical protein
LHDIVQILSSWRGHCAEVGNMPGYLTCADCDRLVF